jgi:DNA-binding NarL/FixJ family response regulator
VKNFNLTSDVSFVFRAYIEGMNNIRVLIVDDVERVRQDLCTFLSLTGNIEVVGEASNGLEAVRLAETLCPQVILMDLEMPVMDGYEAARQIKANHPSCRVIALSIHAGEAERQQALQAGMTDLIVKGAPLEMLLRAIREFGSTAVEP